MGERMNPLDIKFSQSAINREFKQKRTLLRRGVDDQRNFSEVLNSAPPATTVDELLQRLLDGTTMVDDITHITVVNHQDAWYSLDNRRLWVFREYARALPDRTITVPVVVEHDQDKRKELFKKLDNKFNGETIEFHNAESLAQFNEKRTLVNEVLNWSIADIQNDGLFSNQVSPIPLTFSSSRQYFNSFGRLLFEEARAVLKQNLEKLEDAPRGHVCNLRERPSSKEQRPEYKKFTFTIEKLREDEVEVGSGSTPPFRPTDVVLLTTRLPSCAAELQSSQVHYTLALLQADEEKSDDLFFKARVYAPTLAPVYGALLDEKVIWYIVHLSNFATPLRIWDALHAPMEGRNIQDDNPILKQIRDYYTEEGSGTACIEAQKERYMQWFGLNNSQAEACSTAFASLENTVPPFVRLIQGPPGTGKTTVLVALLSVLGTSGERVLLCAPTNVAVCEVASRFLKLLRRGGEPFTSARTKVRSGDILLLGSEERLGEQDGVSDLFISHRIKRLNLALSPSRGWSQKVLSMIDFLTNAEGMYKGRVGVRVSFLQFARAEMRGQGEMLVSNIEVVCNDLPSIYLGSTGILAARGIIEGLLKLMEVDVPDEDAKEWFKGTETAIPGTVAGEVQKLLKLLRISRAMFVVLPYDKVTIERQDLVNCARIVFCTVSSAGSSIMRWTFKFDLVIVDEASQVVEAETTIVMGMRGLKQVVLVGDHHQLPATVFSKLALDNNYGRSTFQRLQELNHPCTMLDTQYRMHPAISQFSSKYIYDGKLKDGPNVIPAEYGSFSQSCLFGPYMFVNVDGREVNDDEHKKTNPMEAMVIVTIFRRLMAECTKNGVKLDVGIISPYRGQVLALQNRLETLGLSPEVKTVDGFQGREKDVILLSTVRSIRLGFLSDYRRLNVAITRARHCVCIVGNAQTLLGEESFWSTLVIDAQRRSCYLEVIGDSQIKRAIVQLKFEERRLEDLLRPDSKTFTNTCWKVHFSHDFIVNFTRLHQDSKKAIFQSILRLADGFRLKKKRKFQVPASISEDIEIYVSSNTYIVWSVAIHPDNHVQIIKIWDVVKLVNLNRILRRLETFFSTYTSTYLSRCRQSRAESGKTLPVTWDGSEDRAWHRPIEKKQQGPETAAETTEGEDSTVADSLHLMKFYKLSPEAARKLYTATDESGCDMLFVVTKEETDAIEYPHSTFILGRSGTGKTTVITDRLLRREFAYASGSFGHVSGKIRQVLVTVSSKLCAAIRRHIERIQRGNTSEEGEDTEALLLDDEAEDNLLGSIPDSFKNLPDKVFPLVITYRKLLAMLEGSVEIPFRVQLQAGDVDFDPAFGRRKAAEVDFSRFATEYWPHMNFSMRKNLEASLVFAEFMSCIKGSAEAQQTPFGRLSKEEYTSMGSKRVSHFDESERGTIYSLYEQYERMKVLKGDYDLGDFVSHLYRQLQRGKYEGAKLHFVYVDEVQDLTLGQISLLRFLTDNCEDGFVFAGDTAQTIAKGVNFRFEDIKSLFYRDFLDDAEASSSTNTKVSPRLHQLTQNFRTHDGIIKLAGCVMEMIVHFFPESVDKLNPETSIVRGDKPVVLDVHDKDMIASLFRIDARTAGGPECEFGAEQVILVRDEQCKQGLLHQLGKSSLVLTIEECKGLEFQDVLLYNFFTSSNFSKWRVLFEYHEASCAFPTFERKRHALLCSELKHLYVALTRAKQRLWVFDESTDSQRPMRECWEKFDLVEVKELDEKLISSIHAVSTPEEWRKRGQEMFAEKQYASAVLCFQRANEPMLTTWAEAAVYQKEAEMTVILNQATKTRRRELFKKAAERYLTVKKFESAAKCYMSCENYRKAGEVYRDFCQPSKPEEAGDCFINVKLYHEAAEAYGTANILHKSLRACELGNLFEKGLSFIEKWRQESANEELNEAAEVFLKKAARKYKSNEASLMRFVNALSSYETKRSFLVTERLFKQLRDVETSAGNFKEASEVAEDMGDVLTAVDLLERAGEYDQAALKILKFIQVEVLWGNGNGGWPLRACENTKLLRKARTLADPRTLHRLKVITTPGSTPVLELLKNWELSKGDYAGELIALRQLLDASFERLESSSGTVIKVDLQLMDEGLESLVDISNSFQLATLTWNSWFGKISALLQALGSVQKMIPFGDAILDSCLEYLGVSRDQSFPGMFVVEDVAASWLQKELLTPMSARGKRGQLRMTRLLLRAKEFWNGYLYRAASDVLDALEKYKRTVDGAERVMVLLKILDIHSDPCSLLWSAEILKAKSLKYRKELYNILFVKPARDMDAASEICALRDEEKVTVQLDERAYEIADNNDMHLSTDECGKLQVLLPFLNKECLGSYLKQSRSLLFDAEVRMQGQDLSELVKFYAKEKTSSLSCSSFVYTVSHGLESLNAVFGMKWKLEEDDFMLPSTFLYLLERSLVMTCTCLRHVTDVILPKGLVLEFMTGQSQEQLYTMMLQANCSNRACQDLAGRLLKIASICKWLLSAKDTTERWLRREQGMDLGTAFYRLLRILMTIFMDMELSKEVTSPIFHILRSLVSQRKYSRYMNRELESAFENAGLTDFALRQTMKTVMASASDPFLMLQRHGKYRIRQRGFVEIVPVEETMWVFSVSRYFTKKYVEQTVVVREPAPVTPQVEDEPTVNTNTYECPQLHELPVEQSEVDDGLPPWFVKRKFFWIVAWKLMKLLKTIREQDEFVREAKREFGLLHTSYVSTFIREVCPLKASFQPFLANLNSALHTAESVDPNIRDELVEKIKDFVVEASPLSKLLDPRHEKHRKQDEEWLRTAVIIPLRQKLEQGKRMVLKGRKVEDLVREILGDEPEEKPAENVAKGGKRQSKHQQKKASKQKKKKNNKK